MYNLLQEDDFLRNKLSALELFVHIEFHVEQDTRRLFAGGFTEDRNIHLVKQLEALLLRVHVVIPGHMTLPSSCSWQSVLSPRTPPIHKTILAKNKMT